MGKRRLKTASSSEEEDEEPPKEKQPSGKRRRQLLRSVDSGGSDGMIEDDGSYVDDSLAAPKRSRLDEKRDQKRGVAPGGIILPRNPQFPTDEQRLRGNTARKIATLEKEIVERKERNKKKPAHGVDALHALGEATEAVGSDAGVGDVDACADTVEPVEDPVDVDGDDTEGGRGAEDAGSPFDEVGVGLVQSSDDAEVVDVDMDVDASVDVDVCPESNVVDATDGPAEGAVCSPSQTLETSDLNPGTNDPNDANQPAASDELANSPQASTTPQTAATNSPEFHECLDQSPAAPTVPPTVPPLPLGSIKATPHEESLDGTAAPVKVAVDGQEPALSSGTALQEPKTEQLEPEPESEAQCPQIKDGPALQGGLTTRPEEANVDVESLRARLERLQEPMPLEEMQAAVVRLNKEDMALAQHAAAIEARRRTLARTRANLLNAIVRRQSKVNANKPHEFAPATQRTLPPPLPVPADRAPAFNNPKSNTQPPPPPSPTSAVASWIRGLFSPRS